MSKKPLFIILTLLSALAVLVSCSNSVDDVFDNQPETIPLTLEFIEDGKFNISLDSYGGDSDVYYSLNGKTKTLLPDETSIKVSKGDKVELFRDLETAKTYKGHFKIECESDCYVYGNVMSLIDSTNYSTATEVLECAFYQLFSNNTHIKNHDTLDLVIPATTLAGECYCSMFSGCTQLTKAPELPATKMADACYASMFSGCVSLTKAPELPGTDLEANCYSCMFRNCTSLKETPVLPAETLDKLYCYHYMFDNCTNLKSVTCLATSIEPPLNVEHWLENAGSAVTGTKEFHCKAGSTIWDSGEYVPSDWTIVKDK